MCHKLEQKQAFSYGFPSEAWVLLDQSVGASNRSPLLLTEWGSRMF